MTMTRRIWRESKIFALDGSLKMQEIVYYDKPQQDLENPDYVMTEQQSHVTIDHTNAVASDPTNRDTNTAGDLTAGQLTKVSTCHNDTKAILDRLKPLNPGQP